jgi:hypothetical protein
MNSSIACRYPRFDSGAQAIQNRALAVVQVRECEASFSTDSPLPSSVYCWSIRNTVHFELWRTHACRAATLGDAWVPDAAIRPQLAQRMCRHERKTVPVGNVSGARKPGFCELRESPFLAFSRAINRVRENGFSGKCRHGTHECVRHGCAAS